MKVAMLEVDSREMHVLYCKSIAGRANTEEDRNAYLRVPHFKVETCGLESSKNNIRVDLVIPTLTLILQF